MRRTRGEELSKPLFCGLIFLRAIVRGLVSEPHPLSS